MQRTVDLMRYVPQMMKEFIEIQHIVDAENPEFQSVTNIVDSISKASFIEDADEVGISRFEKMLGVTSPEGYTLDERRFDIIAKFIENPPFTMNILKDKLRKLCGNNFIVVYIPEEYTLTIGLGIEAMTKYNAVEKMLKNIVPANLIVIISEFYNRHSVLHQFTYGELEEYTHYQLRNEVFS